MSEYFIDRKGLEQKTKQLRTEFDSDPPDCTFQEWLANRIEELQVRLKDARECEVWALIPARNPIIDGGVKQWVRHPDGKYMKKDDVLKALGEKE